MVYAALYVWRRLDGKLRCWKDLAVVATVSKKIILITVNDDKLTSAAMYITSSSVKEKLIFGTQASTAA